MTTSDLQTVAGSSLMGCRVMLRDDHEAGRVQDLVVDPGSGRLVYAVVEFHGEPDLQDRLFAIPWQSLQWDSQQTCVRLDLGRDDLRAAPALDRARWPATDAAWHREVHRFFGVEPYWEGAEHYTG